MQTPMDARTWAEEAYILADELRSLASEGLEYVANSYDRHRYERVLRCSARLPGGLESRPPETILGEFGGDLHAVTPQIGVDAMVLNGERLLLIQRTDNRLWCMPGGAAEVARRWPRRPNENCVKRRGWRAASVTLPVYSIRGCGIAG